MLIATGRSGPAVLIGTGFMGWWGLAICGCGSRAWSSSRSDTAGTGTWGGAAGRLDSVDYAY